MLHATLECYSLRTLTVESPMWWSQFVKSSSSKGEFFFLDGLPVDTYLIKSAVNGETSFIIKEESLDLFNELIYCGL